MKTSPTIDDLFIGNLRGVVPRGCSTCPPRKHSILKPCYNPCRRFRHVRFGSETEVTAGRRHVGFTPRSGRLSALRQCSLSAKSGSERQSGPPLAAKVPPFQAF